MAEKRCDLTDLIVEQCAHCRQATAPAAAQNLGPTLAAGYAGVCSGCGDEFDQGETIQADGQGGWVLTVCCGYV